MHRFHVQSLLAIPALRATVVVTCFRPGSGEVLSVLAGCKRPVAGDLRILVRVAQHGGRGVSVDDRDRLALTGHPRLAHVVGPPNLAGSITAVRPRLGLTVCVGLTVGDLLAVESGARPRDPIVLGWGRER